MSSSGCTEDDPAKTSSTVSRSLLPDRCVTQRLPLPQAVWRKEAGRLSSQRLEPPTGSRGKDVSGKQCVWSPPASKLPPTHGDVRSMPAAVSLYSRCPCKAQDGHGQLSSTLECVFFCFSYPPACLCSGPACATFSLILSSELAKYLA